MVSTEELQSDLDERLERLRVDDELNLRCDIRIAGTAHGPHVVSIDIQAHALKIPDANRIIQDIGRVLLGFDADVILDLSPFPGLSSMGVNGLARIAANGKNFHRVVYVSELCEPIRELLHVTNMHQIIGITDTVEEAVKQVCSSSGTG